MKIVLDTNVLISGIFFSGPPYEILRAWRDGRVQLLVSPSILDEYHRIGAELALQFQGVDLKPFLDLLTVQAEIVLAPALPPVIRDDPSCAAERTIKEDTSCPSGKQKLLGGFHFSVKRYTPSPISSLQSHQLNF